MHVRFWGTRGSIPSPGSGTAIYGGNTPCVEVRASDGTLIIFDCGTGIRELGAELLRSNQIPARIYLLISHTHWDHIQGFPFFSPAFLPNVELHIFAPAGFERNLEDAMSGQMQHSYFPVKLQDLASRIYYNEVEEGFFRLGEVLVETQYLNHTAPTVAYRLTEQTTTIAYVSDHEPFWNFPGPLFLHPGDRRHVEFLKGADLVIHDAQYTAEEYKTNLGWGHSPMEYATGVAVASKVKRLALFHHDPAHDDAALKRLEKTARERAAFHGANVDIFCASEGMHLEVRGTGRTAPIATMPALERRPIEGSRILLLLENRMDAAAVKAILAGDGFAVTPAADIHSALELIPNLHPDMVIMSEPINGKNGNASRHIESLRASGKPDLPVLLLTDMREDNHILSIVQAKATDYIANPFNPAMLRSRVRAWLARTIGTDPAITEPAGPNTGLQFSIEKSASSTAHPGADAILVSSSLFGSLAGPELAKLRENASEHIYPTGHRIVRQGEYSDSMYVVLSGRARAIEGVTVNPVDTVLGEFGPGEVFGELGVLMQQPRSATVFALERTRCLKISQTDFISALQNSPEMLAALLRILADRLHETDRLLARTAPDALTGLPSRRTFHYIYRRLAASARRRRSSVLLIALDIVQLKTINERFGYGVGDDVIAAVADALLEFSNNTDLVARYGGDEFALLLLDVNVEDAQPIVDRLQSQLQQKFLNSSFPAVVNCSIGYAASRTAPGTADALLQRADQDLQAKRRKTPLLR